MSHLTDLELVDAVDGRDDVAGTLAADRRLHLDACDLCRARVDELRAVIAHAAGVDVPEPSPLFWNHFNARVRDGIDGAQPGESVGGRWLPAWVLQGGVRWAAFATLVVALMVVGVWRISAPTRRLGPAAVDRGADAQRIPTSAESLDKPDADADPAWAVVRTVADSVKWDDAVAGIGAEPGAAETVAGTLSPEERSELVKLLLAETKRPGA
jgi:hypothetical protein